MVALSPALCTRKRLSWGQTTSGPLGVMLHSTDPEPRAPGSDLLPRLDFRAGGLNQPDVLALLRTHLHSATEHSPADSIHALDLDGLRAPDMQFWSVWAKTDLVGMCALKSLNDKHAEIKSMRTVATWRRRGVGDAMMAHLLATAVASGLRWLSLETGTAAAYAPARRLYPRHGFTPCPPFAGYRLDPHSCYMRCELPAAGSPTPD